MDYPYNEVRVRTHSDGSVVVRFTLQQDYPDTTESDVATAIGDLLLAIPNADQLTKVNRSQSIVDTNL